MVLLCVVAKCVPPLTRLINFHLGGPCTVVEQNLCNNDPSVTLRSACPWEKTAISGSSSRVVVVRNDFLTIMFYIYEESMEDVFLQERDRAINYSFLVPTMAMVEQ